jgi:predicted short-subunit dehydrogenase-like oxidoreductase (DUF2520 family)
VIKRIGIVGAGKVGISLAFILKRKGFTISGVSDNLASSLQTARSYLGEEIFYTRNNKDIITLSDAIAITTQDRVIKDIVAEVDANMEDLTGKLFFHTSGADPSSILKPLDKKGALLGSLHPLQTFPDIESAIEVLPETCIFIEGDETAIELLRHIGEHTGSGVFIIEGKDKVLYHLCAVFVCNLLCALFYTGESIMDKIGIEFAPFIPIIRATIKNIEKKGPLASLTGPVVRGDAKTVKAHLGAMEDMEQQKKIYRALSEVALEMTAKRGVLDEKTLKALRAALDRSSSEL